MSEDEETDGFEMIMRDLFKAIIRMHVAAEENCVLMSFSCLHDEEKARALSHIVVQDEQAGVAMFQLLFASFQQGIKHEEYSRLHLLIEEVKKACDQSVRTIYQQEGEEQ